MRQKILIARRILFPAPIPENYHREADPVSGPGVTNVYTKTFPLKTNSRYRQSMQKYCMLYFTAAGSLFGYTAKYYCNSSVQVARRTGKSVDDAVGFLSSLLELCETTVVRVCV